MDSQLVYGMYLKPGWLEFFPRIFPDLIKERKDAWATLPNMRVSLICLQSEAGRL